MLLLLLTIPLVCTVLSLLPMNNRMRIMLLLLVSLGHAAMTASFWRALPGAEFNGIIVLDNIGLILLSVISLLFTSVSLYMIGYFDHEKRNNRVFVLCLSLLMSVMSLVAVSYHIGLMWVAIATTTLFSAPLISFHRNKNSLEATWKYLLVCSVGIAMALMGTFFLAISAHGLDTLLLPGLLNGAGQLSGNWLKLSVIFLLVGYGCKMGLAPMHSWKPEAYGHSIGIATVIMAGGTTQCAFLALVRVSQICSKAGLSGFYSSILILTGIISLVVPAVFILGERNIKRIFSYSSVEHMGILILGLAFGGPGIFGSFFHMVNNALAKVAMFLTAGSIAQKYGSSRADDIKGVIHAYPVTGVFLLAGL
ncbi:MAG TPA: proton-conducting transporter membrane subunit, partial [Candidatus Omnitrophota bacterium]|nr:proton-conducting transporter membrane subunit [Candidatus Omnitrophota bacterium]